MIILVAVHYENIRHDERIIQNIKFKVDVCIWIKIVIIEYEITIQKYFLSRLLFQCIMLLSSAKQETTKILVTASGRISTKNKR